MKVKLQIVSLFCILLSLLTAAVSGQDLPSTCGGSHVRYGVTGEPSSIFNWEVTGGTILNNYNDSVDIEWEQTEGIKTIRVTEYTETNCVGTPKIGHVMVASAAVDIGNAVEICEGETHTFAPSSLYTLYSWNTGEKSSSIVAGTGGTYWVDITDSRGCRGRDSAELIVKSKIKVSLGLDTALCPDEKLTLDAGFEGSQYVWSTGDIGQSIEVGPGQQNIWVDVTSDNGCTTRDSIAIDICDYEKWVKQFEIPNAFTPNGDNDNDSWHLSWMKFFPDASVEIYDRWGRIVFKSKGLPTEGWDGKSNGKPLPMDSYYYIIDVGNGINPIVGNVTIIR